MLLVSNVTVTLVDCQEIAMSRFHPVRPKKDKHAHRAPQPAAPAQPTPSQADKVALERVEQARSELYKLHNGDVLDASIARWKRMLAIYDREAEVVFSSDMSKPHRWTVSPAMALRAEKHLEGLLQRQAELLDECHAQAHQIVSDYYARQAASAGSKQADADSLCPPKQTPAPGADFQPVQNTTSNPSKGGEHPPASA
jgi:hypothetical protein